MKFNGKLIWILFICALLFVISNQQANAESIQYDIRDFGAVGDWNGVTGTDDSAAIQAAINTAALNNGAVIFPSGYKFRANNLVLKSGVTIIGHGSTIVNDADLYEKPTFNAVGSATTTTTLATDRAGGAFAGAAPVTITVTNITGFAVGDDIELADDNASEFNTIKVIDGTTITLKRRPIHTYAIAANAKITKINLIENVTIKGLTIYHTNPISFAVKANYLINSNFEDLIISNPVHGVYLQNSEGITVSRCRIDPKLHGVSLNKTTRHCKAVDNTITYAKPAVLVAGEFAVIANNNIYASGDGTSGDGITIWGSDNTIHGNTIMGGDCYGIWIAAPAEYGYNPQRNQIIGNIIEANITVGIYVNGGSHHSVCNNTLRQNSNGVSISGATGCIVENNIIVANDSIGIALFSEYAIVRGNIINNNAIYGLYMYGNADYCIVANNAIDGTGGMFINSKMHNIVKDNIINGVI